MFILLVMLAIVIVWLLIMSRQKVAPIDTKLFPADQQTVASPAPEQLETAAAPEVQPEAEAPTPADMTVVPEETTTVPDQEATVEPVASGTLVDTGMMRTYCPDGWLNVEQYNVFGVLDENGQYPANPAKICLYKGAASIEDTNGRLTVSAELINTAISQEDIDGEARWSTESEPFTITINGTECQGFHAKEEDTFAAGQFYEYDFVFIPVSDSSHIKVIVQNSLPNVAETISLNDPDVQLILNGLAVD